MLAIKVVWIHKGIFLSSPLNSQELSCNTQCKYSRNSERGRGCFGVGEIEKASWKSDLNGGGCGPLERRHVNVWLAY